MASGVNRLARNRAAGRKPKLGSGKRFKNLVAKIAARGDVRDPEAVAAAIGRARYGKKRFQRLAARGRSRHA